MSRWLKRTFSAVLVVVVLFAVPAQVLAETADQRFAALEARVTALEKALALSTIDVTGIVKKAAPAVVSIYVTDKDDEVQKQGTGFIYDADGYILTNAHVVDTSMNLKAKFSDGTVKDATWIFVDPFLDVAILSVEGTGYPTLKFAGAKPQVGASLMVIGNAYGYSNSVTFGIVSGVDRPDPSHLWHYPSLQTDAAINHGNSGGPILNADGEVVAMATWTEVKGETDGIAFGIPTEVIMGAFERYDEKRGIVRPWLGISAQEPYWSRGGLPNTLGLMITDVHPKGAGAAAGLKRLDFITKVNNVSVNYLLELRTELEKYKPKTIITLTVVRKVNGTYQTLQVKTTLGEFSVTQSPYIPDQSYDSTTDDIF